MAFGKTAGKTPVKAPDKNKKKPNTGSPTNKKGAGKTDKGQPFGKKKGC